MIPEGSENGAASGDEQGTAIRQSAIFSGPMVICIIYFFFGILWIIFSDRIFLSFARSPEEVVTISSVKGVFFIIVTTLLLFLLIRSFARRLEEKNEELQARNEALLRMQREWGSTYNAISDWLALVSPQGTIIRSNIAGEALFPIPAQQMQGRTLFELTGERPETALLQRVLASRKREVAESPSLDGNGWVQIAVDPVLSPSGEVVSAVLIVRDITERTRTQKALEHAKKKLSLLNHVTFDDLRNLIFTLSGYRQYLDEIVPEGRARDIIRKQKGVLDKITQSLNVARSYQDLGLKPAKWQNVNHVFLLAISHLDFQCMQRAVSLDNLEVFADPLLEQVFQILADNTLLHGETADTVTFRYGRDADSLILFFEDNGVGIPAALKEKIFLSDFPAEKRAGLFLAREILEITGITIRETGAPGKGARFEMRIPKGGFRFPGNPGSLS